MVFRLRASWADRHAEPLVRSRFQNAYCATPTCRGPPGHGPPRGTRQLTGHRHPAGSLPAQIIPGVRGVADATVFVRVDAARMIGKERQGVGTFVGRRFRHQLDRLHRHGHHAGRRQCPVGGRKIVINARRAGWPSAAGVSWRPGRGADLQRAAVQPFVGSSLHSAATGPLVGADDRSHHSGRPHLLRGTPTVLSAVERCAAGRSRRHSPADRWPPRWR